MGTDMEQLYQARMKRYVTAMRNEKPDIDKAFAAARKCAADFDWDAVVGNMVYVWTGLTEAIGTKYYAVPGIDLKADNCFQYREPSEDDAFMKADEYDQLIADPTGFLFNVWLPRVSRDVSAMGQETSMRNNLSFLKGGMAMLNYFNAFGTQAALLRSESGTVSAISGILKAPLDIIADKMRGYLGLVSDLMERPKKVMAACEALMPHLTHVALSGADPDKNVPIGFWMHRGCVPFVTMEHFHKFFWATLKLMPRVIGLHIWIRLPSCRPVRLFITSIRRTSSRHIRKSAIGSA